MFLWESLLAPDWLPQMMRWLKAAHGKAKSLLEKGSYSDKGLKDGTFHSPNIMCLFSWLEALDSAIRCPEQDSVWFTQKQVLIQPCMVTNQQGRPNGVNIVERYPGEVAAMGGNQTKSSQFVSYVVSIQICKIWICICMYVCMTWNRHRNRSKTIYRGERLTAAEAWERERRGLWDGCGRYAQIYKT